MRGRFLDQIGLWRNCSGRMTLLKMKHLSGLGWCARMHRWSGKPLGAWAAEGVEARMGPSDGQVFDNFAAEYLDIWQEIGEK